MAALPEIKKKFQEVFPEKQAQVLSEFADLYNDLVKASDFVELKQIVKELAEAQKQSEVRLGRLETAVAELAEAQKRTEQRVEELAEAQKRTEERVGGLERALQELAEAQRLADQRMAELAEAQRLADQRMAELVEVQKRTEERVGGLERALQELAEAQKRTEEELQKLTAEHAETRRQLGGLAMTVGYTLENEAYKALPALLQQDYGLVVEGRLKRAHVPLGNGDYLEVNILGDGTLGGRKVKIVGESKAQLSKNDVDRFLKRKLGKLKGAFPEVFPVLVTHMTTSPEVEEYAKEKGIAVYYSYEF
ncbi:hypothetical protein [Desulfovirgula thermocuniculi]|uniref:hypothetical protein n=1 Tax=Desulfovirgula thermocuniculi TaxID=348842 RepID=UPI0006872EAA|nr:hypothetical protein [Desulfovirgula thermocuniculi]